MELGKDEIIYFDLDEQNGAKNHLKIFVNFLLQSKVKKPYRFSFVAENLNFIPSLSLEENILLDAIPTSLRSGDNFDLTDYIKATNNIHLFKLFKNISDLKVSAEEANSECKKIASLVKAILKEESDFLFLISPEKQLAQHNYHLLKESLSYQVQNIGLTVFISSKDTKAWASLITKQVKVTSNNKYVLTETLRSAPQAKVKHVAQEVKKPSSATILAFNKISNDDKEAA